MKGDALYNEIVDRHYKKLISTIDWSKFPDSSTRSAIEQVCKTMVETMIDEMINQEAERIKELFFGNHPIEPVLKPNKFLTEFEKYKS